MDALGGTTTHFITPPKTIRKKMVLPWARLGAFMGLFTHVTTRTVMGLS